MLPKAHRKVERRFDRHRYRNIIERFIAEIKEFHRVAARDNKRVYASDLLFSSLQRYFGRGVK